MCDFELDFSSVENKFKINFSEYFKTSLEGLKEFIDDGLVKLSDNKLHITQMGRLLIRNIAMNFDWYIEQKADKAKYSRTV